MNGKKTTCATVNALLRKEGITSVKMYRNNQGGDYYYFICDGTLYIESIMQYSIADDDPMDYVKIVKQAIAEHEEAGKYKLDYAIKVRSKKAHA